MKTSVIRYRVADFLRQFPPFDLLHEAEVLSLASGGRVIFHESDEYVFRQGQERLPRLWVIQQGKIKIVEERGETEILRDLLGEGDLLGLGGVLAGSFYRYSARTTSDVILYSIDAGAFLEAAGRHSSSSVYVAANFPDAPNGLPLTAASGIDTAGDRHEIAWLESPAPPLERAVRRLVLCKAGESLRELARRMTERRTETAVVTGDTGRPIGVVNSRSLCEQFAAGCETLDTFAEPCAVSPGLPVKMCFLEMVRGRCQSLVVTADGSLECPPEGILTAADLALSCGRNPMLVIQELVEAECPSDLAYGRSRLMAMIAEGLTAPALVPWFSSYALEIDVIILGRVVEWTLADAGAPQQNACWLFFGASGRGDSPAITVPDFGIVLPDIPPEQEQAARDRWTLIAGHVEARLLECGYRPRAGQRLLKPHTRCRTLSAWKEFFASRIQDPIGNAIFESRSLFDMRLAFGDRDLLDSLLGVIDSELRGSDSFLAVLANDTMGSLPPLTFYRDVVVDIDGSEKSALDLDTAGLRPLEDAARVFALARHDLAVTSTVERLEAAAQAMPVYRSVFREAAEAFRVVACHRAISSLGRQEDSGIIYPSALSRYEQTELKKTFQSIHSFLEFTEFNADTLALL